MTFSDLLRHLRTLRSRGVRVVRERHRADGGGMQTMYAFRRIDGRCILWAGERSWRDLVRGFAERGQ
jgi:hypothetical protein